MTEKLETSVKSVINIWIGIYWNSSLWTFFVQEYFAKLVIAIATAACNCLTQVNFIYAHAQIFLNT
jgi:hypothetical protein